MIPLELCRQAGTRNMGKRCGEWREDISRHSNDATAVLPISMPGFENPERSSQMRSEVTNINHTGPIRTPPSISDQMRRYHSHHVQKTYMHAHMNKAKHIRVGDEATPLPTNTLYVGLLIE